MANNILSVGVYHDEYEPPGTPVSHPFLRIPNAGSFIRPSVSICYGISFLTALRLKYIEMQHGSASLEKVVLGSSNGAIEVEPVGLDKIRGKFAQLERLREVSVDYENVATADSPGEIRNTCPSMYSDSSSNNCYLNVCRCSRR